MLLHHLQWFGISEDFIGCDTGWRSCSRVDTKQVEDIAENVELFATIETKVKSRSWVKKHESQTFDRDKLKLKAVVLHDSHEDVHMTQPDRLAAAIQVQVLELDGAHSNELRLA